MDDVRTEEAALGGFLSLSMDGRQYQVPVLTIERSDAWLRLVADATANVRLPSDDDGGAIVHQLLTASAGAALDLVVAYDRTGVLGGADAIRAAMSKRELRSALETMVTAEDPYGEDGAHSVAVALGAPTRMVGYVMDQALEAMASLLRVPSTPMPSATGGSDTTPSVVPGPESSSSSGGPTRRKPKSPRPGTA